MKKGFSLLFIVFVIAGLISCTGAPERNLASDAVLCHKGVTTKEKAQALLGPPDQVVHRSAQLEDWYYYQTQKSTLHKLPLIGPRLIHPETEILRLTFKGDTLIDCIYYVVEGKNGT